MRKLTTQGLYLVLAVITGCQWSEDRYLKRRVDASELVGRWQITPTGIEGAIAAWNVAPEETRDHFIHLRSDGSCEIRAFENFMKPRDGRVVETSCVWRLGDDAKHQQLRVESASVDAKWFFYFDEENGALLLWDYTMDPDQWKYYEFAKPRSGLTDGNRG